MTWFVDKLGPRPGAQLAGKSQANGRAGPQQPQRSAPPQQAKQAPASRAAAPPPPEKPKKKGWF